jgi:hypothetical protein
MTSSPILIYPCLEKEFILDTDASGTGTGAVLSQIGDDPRRLLWSGTRNISWELFLILHLSYDQIHFGAW